MKTKKILSFLFLLITAVGFSQKKQLIKDKEDYIFFTKIIERIYSFKQQRDSLDLIDIEILKKKYSNKKEEFYLRTIKELKEEIANDTIYIKAIADKSFFNTFFDKKAKWRKKTNKHKKETKLLECVLSKKEIKNYKKQLKDNFYYWSGKNLTLKIPIIINNRHMFTKEEARKKGIIERNISSNLNKKQYYTFSKPIYSRNKKYALIASHYYRITGLYIFEKVNKNWVIKNFTFQ